MNDVEILKNLTAAYAEAAQDPFSQTQVHTYRELNALRPVKPPVLVFEEPWGEFDEVEPLQCLCTHPKARALEWQLRSELYKWNHHRGSYALHPYWGCPVVLRAHNAGYQAQENVIESGSGSAIMSHEYHDQLPDESALGLLTMPELERDDNATRENVEFCAEAFAGRLPVKKTGYQYYLASWDQFPRLHGVENCLTDLVDRPEYVHAVMERFTRVNLKMMDEYERLNVLETDPYYLHCTPAATCELPVKDMDSQRITSKDVWCRAMAQLLGVVSPEMLEEFDLQYTKRYFDRCGLAYYGCCEPLHNKIGKLRQFRNLRRISITPWADVEMAAGEIGGDYVLSYKSNPAHVASPVFDPEPVIRETRRVLAACRRHRTPCEFILKDISTVCRNPDHLRRWVETTQSVIDAD